jgi:3-hydroxybutyryl-CoA dehydratase
MADAPPARPGSEPRGRTFDQLEVGQVFVSPPRTITEAEILEFARISGDRNPLHVDREYAAATVFKVPIAHGLLVQSVASGLAWDLGIFDRTIAALKEMVIRFQNPVMPGDTIRLELAVGEKDPAPSSRRGWIRFDARVENQRGDTVIEGSWTTLMNRRSQRGQELTRKRASG